MLELGGTHSIISSISIKNGILHSLYCIMQSVDGALLLITSRAYQHCQLTACLTWRHRRNLLLLLLLLLRGPSCLPCLAAAAAAAWRQQGLGRHLHHHVTQSSHSLVAIL
jgi:hypothetical protein